MKIRTKLTLRYLFVTALLVIAVFFVLEELLFPQAGYDMLHILNTRLLAGMGGFIRVVVCHRLFHGTQRTKTSIGNCKNKLKPSPLPISASVWK